MHQSDDMVDSQRVVRLRDLRSLESWSRARMGTERFQSFTLNSFYYYFMWNCWINKSSIYSVIDWNWKWKIKVISLLRFCNIIFLPLIFYISNSLMIRKLKFVVADRRSPTQSIIVLFTWLQKIQKWYLLQNIVNLHQNLFNTNEFLLLTNFEVDIWKVSKNDMKR